MRIDASKLTIPFISLCVSNADAVQCIWKSIYISSGYTCTNYLIEIFSNAGNGFGLCATLICSLMGLVAVRIVLYFTDSYSHMFTKIGLVAAVVHLGLTSMNPRWPPTVDTIQVCSQSVHKHVLYVLSTWFWHDQSIFFGMMTSSDGNISRVAGPLWGGTTGHRWFPSQRPVTQSFDVFFELHPNKRLSKQSRRRWFETPLRWLWCHCNNYDQVPYPLSKIDSTNYGNDGNDGHGGDANDREWVLVSFRIGYITYWGRGKMAAILQIAFPNACSWTRIVVFLFKFHWNICANVQWTKCLHWFR